MEVSILRQSRRLYGCSPSKGLDCNPNSLKAVHEHVHVHVNVDVDVHVLVDVDGLFKSNKKKGVTRTPENVKLLLPPRQSPDYGTHLTLWVNDAI